MYSVLVSQRMNSPQFDEVNQHLTRLEPIRRLMNATQNPWTLGLLSKIASELDRRARRILQDAR